MKLWRKYINCGQICPIWHKLRSFWKVLTRWHMSNRPRWNYLIFFFFFFFFETEGRRASAKAHEAINVLASFCQVERRFHNEESNRRPLPWDLGISPPSSNSLWSYRTNKLSHLHFDKMWRKFTSQLLDMYQDLEHMSRVWLIRCARFANIPISSE